MSFSDLMPVLSNAKNEPHKKNAHASHIPNLFFFYVRRRLFTGQIKL